MTSSDSDVNGLSRTKGEDDEEVTVHDGNERSELRAAAEDEEDVVRFADEDELPDG